MEIDNYIRKIMASDDENKKEQFIHWLCEVMDEANVDKEAIEIALYELTEGRVLNEERARHLIENMKPFGMKWTLEETEGVRKQYGYDDIRSIDFWIVMNSAYNDYNDLFNDNIEYYAKFTRDFIKDEDAKEDKVYYYFSMIPRG